MNFNVHKRRDWKHGLFEEHSVGAVLRDARRPQTGTELPPTTSCLHSQAQMASVEKFGTRSGGSSRLIWGISHRPTLKLAHENIQN
jgi:hypothetical protein